MTLGGNANRKNVGVNAESEDQGFGKDMGLSGPSWGE
jgi:hypothetical protein